MCVCKGGILVRSRILLMRKCSAITALANLGGRSGETGNQGICDPQVDVMWEASSNAWEATLAKVTSAAAKGHLVLDTLWRSFRDVTVAGAHGADCWRGSRPEVVSVLNRRAHDKQKAVWQTSGERWGQIHSPTVSQAHFWNCYSEPSTSPFQKFFETKASIYHDGGVHGCCWHAHVSNETERKRWWVTLRGEQRMDHLEIKPNGFLPLRSCTNISKIHHFIICTNLFILL